MRQPKFYEFNADTPTSLLEAGSIQWLWLEQTGNGGDQYNSITKNLITALETQSHPYPADVRTQACGSFRCRRRRLFGGGCLQCDVLDGYLIAGGLAYWHTKALTIEEISVSKNDGRFYDANGDHLDVILKLYPWEFMV